MKNFLWFAHVPVDEREEILFAVAYKRSLSVVWIALVLLIVLGKSISVIGISTILIALLVISYLVGWWTLRHEDMAQAEPSSRPSMKMLWFLAAGLGAATLLAMIFNPAGYIRNATTFMITYPLLLIVWALWTTKSWRLHARILLSVLLPFVAIAITRPRKKLVTGLVLFLFPFAVTAIIRFFIVFPIFVNTSAFEPELHEGEFVLVYKLNRNYAPQDLVVVKYGSFSEYQIVRADSVSPPPYIKGKIIRQ